MKEARLPGSARIPRIRCSEPALAKAAQIAGGNAAGPPRLAGGWERPLTPCRTGCLRCGLARQGTDRDAGLGGDVLETALSHLVLLVLAVLFHSFPAGEQVEVGLVAGGDRPGSKWIPAKPRLSSGRSVATIRDRTAALSKPSGPSARWLPDLRSPRVFFLRPRPCPWRLRTRRTEP